MTSVATQIIENPEEQFTPIPIADITAKRQLLESVFNKIYTERMHDVPIINDKISVSAVGFQQWQNSILGILVTPWFMNIMLLPGQSENWDERQELSEKTHFFPSGKYTFLMAFEEDIGRYQICSLFSPMFEFADDFAAVDTATHALRELMNLENVEENDIDSAQIERIWNGEEQLPEQLPKQLPEKHPEALSENTEKTMADSAVEGDTIATTTKQKKPSISEKMEKPMSRRDMMRGTFLRDEKSL